MVEVMIIGTHFPVRSMAFYVLKEGMLPEEQVEEFLQFTLVAIYEVFTPLIFLAG